MIHLLFFFSGPFRPGGTAEKSTEPTTVPPGREKKDPEPSAEALGYYQKSLTGLERPDTAS
jgi:hypothetical protein